MAGKFRLLYSETSRKQIKKLHPRLKPLIKSKIGQIREDPYIGKSLERELSGYHSIRTKRYRIIYRILEDKRIIQIYYVGHRRDIYELFGDEIRSLKDAP
jgi:mRNA interferase RelE/StbE